MVPLYKNMFHSFYIMPPKKNKSKQYGNGIIKDILKKTYADVANKYFPGNKRLTAGEMHPPLLV